MPQEVDMKELLVSLSIMRATIPRMVYISDNVELSEIEEKENTGQIKYNEEIKALGLKN